MRKPPDEGPIARQWRLPFARTQVHSGHAIAALAIGYEKQTSAWRAILKRRPVGEMRAAGQIRPRRGQRFSLHDCGWFCQVRV